MATPPMPSPDSAPNRLVDLVDRDRLRDAWTNATGRGVRVGLLDSGVSSWLGELEGSVVSNREVLTGPDGRPLIVDRPGGEDVLDHGTASAFLIHEAAPEAEIHSIRVLEPDHRARSADVIAAIEFAIEQRWDVVNLSLGTESNVDAYVRVAEEARRAGVLLVAAKANQPERSGYPACLSSVLGVDLEHFEDPDEFRFYPDRDIEVEAAGVYVRAPDASGRWRYFTGSSFACPRVTGRIARLREVFPGLSGAELRVALAALSVEEDRGSSPVRSESEAPGPVAVDRV